jgi:uncharacterized membrane protein
VTYLALGVLIFGGLHLASIFFPKQRDALKARLGRGRYIGVYSLLSVLGLVFLALGYAEGGAASAEVYQPWGQGRHAMIFLVFIGFLLIFSNQSKGYITKTVRNPFSIGIALWAFGHLLANGEVYSVVIFGTMLAVALLDILANEMRGKRPTFAPHWTQDLRSVVVGVVLFLVFALGFHPYVLGIPVVG